MRLSHIGRNQRVGTLEEKAAVSEGVVVKRTRKKSAVWDALLVEEMPLVGGICADHTVVGIGFTTDDGSIRIAIKKGISIQGAVVLRPR